jgi:hypothetical protein
MFEWKEVSCSLGRAPWIADKYDLSLSVQPYYGDGIWWKVIVQHSEWTFTLKAHFTSMKSAMLAAENWAEKLHKLD